MTNREKILSQPFKNVILENTRYKVDDLKIISPMCEFFKCFFCQFKYDKDCEKRCKNGLTRK